MTWEVNRLVLAWFGWWSSKKKIPLDSDPPFLHFPSTGWRKGESRRRARMRGPDEGCGKLGEDKVSKIAKQVLIALIT